MRYRIIPRFVIGPILYARNATRLFVLSVDQQIERRQARSARIWQCVIVGVLLLYIAALLYFGGR